VLRELCSIRTIRDTLATLSASEGRLAYWWSHDPEEVFWLEITDRDDLGTDLKAPDFKEDGKPFWSYSLVRDVQAGHVILHYEKRERAITSFSTATGAMRAGNVLWGARGSSARNAGVKPHDRPGVYQELREWHPLPEPLTLEELRSAGPRLTELRSRLKAKVDGALYLPFELSPRRPLRMMQGYLAKLPLAVVSMFPKLEPAIRTTAVRKDVVYVQTPRYATSRVAASGPLVPYRPAEAAIPQVPIQPSVMDPDVLERGLRSHVDLQNRFAEAVQAAGKPRYSPRGEPEFDLAWESDGVLFVAEVKSLTDANEERQLRMALGQVLRYQHLLQGTRASISAVIAVEREPSDPRWLDLCRSLGIALVWPGTFEALLLARS
jgi:hypothetical protein